jgi:hypothetical protein
MRPGAPGAESGGRTTNAKPNENPSTKFGLRETVGKSKRKT